MDPLSSLLESLDQAAGSAQDVLVPASATNLHPSKSLQSAQPSLHPSKSLRSAQPWSFQSATDEAAIDADGEDSSLLPVSPGVIRLPRWEDLGKSYALNHNLMHKFIPSFSFKGTVTKPRSSSYSSSVRAAIPCLSSAALQDGSYQPGRVYHSTHEYRRDFPAE